jgi:hypothetical protein
MAPTLTVALALAAVALGEAAHLDSPHTLAIERDFLVLANSAKSGAESTAALVDLSTTLAAAAASHSGNPTIVNAAKVIADFPAAKANLESGQAVVIASPHVDGRDCLLVLVEKGGSASAALGV